MKKHAYKAMLLCLSLVLMGTSACQFAPLPGSSAPSSSTTSPSLIIPTPTTLASSSAQTDASQTQPTTTEPSTTAEASSETSGAATSGSRRPSPDGRVGAQLDTPYLLKGVILVNKKHHVSANYKPAVTDENRPMDPVARAALTELLQAAEAAGHSLSKNSAYRSYDTQSELYWAEVKNLGSEEEANKWTAYPGESEHQTGLAVDLTDDNNPGVSFTDAFGNLESAQWLAANAYKFGFILRFPKGKESITGYSYEGWHYRYVGKEIAAAFGPNSNLTLEEYLGDN